MSYQQALILNYSTILFSGYFISSLILYFFGWYTDKRLRLVSKKTSIKPFERIFLHFRGSSKENVMVHSLICVSFERAALIILFGFNALSFLMAKITGDMMLFRRISFGVLALTIIATIVAVTCVSIMFRNRMNEVSKKGKVKFKSYRELDCITFRLHNISAWSPEFTKVRPENRDLPEWGKHVVDFSQLMGIEEGKRNSAVKTPKNYEYIPAAENKNSDRPTGVMEKRADRKLQDDEFAENTDDSNEANALHESINKFKQKSIIDDEFTADYSQVNMKYNNVPVTESFSNGVSIEEGKEFLQKKTQMPLGTGHGSNTSVENPDIESLREHGVLNKPKDESVPIGSMKDKIDEYKKSNNPQNKLGTGM